MLDNTEGNGPNDIAIVGMALRVPGARSVEEFWTNLTAGRESVRTLSEDELTQSGESSERMHHPNYVRRAADLAGMEAFDAEFFGLSPKEAAIMDPQHRQFLECAWEAMEDAGHTPDQANGPVGVFAGCGMGSYFYFNVCSNRALVDQVGMFLLRHTGNDKDFLSTRASFTFDLRGPSVNVQTACSTSLVAIHYACQSLLNGECDMALAGGVTIELPHRRGYMFEDGEILSPDGHCRPFDHRAAGTLFGSGVGTVALRRLADAIADGDVIHAVIKSTAINNDGGNKAGYLAPSAAGQAAAILEAQTIAGISADTIHYVECHGTGTAIGDPIEIEALTQAFRETTDARGYCHVGSVKSNIGHLDTAAGVVSLIKAALAVKHGQIPPTLGFERPNPGINFVESPFVVANELTSWPLVLGRRRAAVNSLGVGGTNAHAILEQAPHRSTSRRDAERPVLLVLSGRNQLALDETGARLKTRLEQDPSLSLQDVSYTLWNGRKRFDHNRVIAAASREDAITALGEPTRYANQSKPEAIASAAFLFPGGGAQHRRMAVELYRNDASFRMTIDEGLASLSDQAQRAIRSAWFDDAADGAADPLLRPSVQLPAILLVEVAVARVWMRHGVKPAALLGHSMGENAAACIAGVFDLADAVRLVRLRGELFDTITPGGMLSVPLSGPELRDILPPALDIASINAPGLSVVSGLNADLESFAALLAAKDISCARIPIDIAAHSRSLDAILPQWESFLRSIILRAPLIPIVSNLTGDWLQPEQATDPMYWVRHLRSTVLFADCMAKLADPRRMYIEVGPGKTLTSLAKAQGSIAAERVINSLPHPDEASNDSLHLMSALGRAAIAGLPVEPTMLWGGGEAKRVTLPTYPFQHGHYFIERACGVSEAQAGPELVKQMDISSWGYRQVWKQSVADCEFEATLPPANWLVFVDAEGRADLIVHRLRQEGHCVVTVSAGDAFSRRSSDDYVLCPELGEAGYSELLRGLIEDHRLPSRIVHMWLHTGGEDARPGSNVFHRNQECGFYSLFYLLRALGEYDVKSEIHISVVTNGMHKVGSEAVPHPEKATVLGPGLVAAREMPGLAIRLIDVEAPTLAKHLPLFSFGKKAIRSDAVHELLWADLMSSPASEVVAYRGAKRWTRSHAPFKLDQFEAGLDLLKIAGTYLFTGGLGGISNVLCRQLATQLKANLVLIGRTALPPRSEWTAHQRQTRHGATVRSIEAILDLEARGAQVLYVSADVTNLDSVTAALDAARDRFGRIDGVFHAAGSVEDALIQTKTLDSIERVLAPKLIGTRVLDEALRPLDIDFLVLFSSTSTITAPAGQADYVAANAYLDAYADSCAGLKRRTISLHWGIWNEVGLGARAAGMLTEPTQIDDEVPCNGLFDKWVRDETGLVWLQAEIGPSSTWYLDEHRLISGVAVLPGTAYFEFIAQAAKAHGLAQQLHIRDLVMLRPLVVPDGECRTIQLALEQSGDHLRVTIRAGTADDPSSFAVHVEARLAVDLTPAPRVDLEALYEQLPWSERAADGTTLRSAQERHIKFGPRWQLLQSTAFGREQALGKLHLNDSFLPDLQDQVLIHPSLLDIATGFALPLVEAFDHSDVLWVPASYGEVRIYGRLPSTLVSHVALAPTGDLGPGYACFDIFIADPEGRLVFEAKRFLMKRMSTDNGLADGVTLGSGQSINRTPATAPNAATLRLAVQVRQGISPKEGFDALVRSLGSGLSQPIVSSLDLSQLCARTASPQVSLDVAAFERPEMTSQFVAPRDALETTIAGYWQELLGIAKVGVNDNFFDLGGHSLIAVRLFRMIKKEFGVDVPMSILFEAPTIAECAKIVAPAAVPPETASQAQPAIVGKPTQRIHLSLMHPGQNPDAVPLFICAGMFGNILNLRHLAHQIGADRPVYGLQARGLYGDMEPHETFDAMAASCIAEIKTVRPNGPYHLAGYSGGGITALEIARQLNELGEETPHLIMLDTPQPTQPPLSVSDKIAMKAQDLRRDKVSYLGRWLRDRNSWRRQIRLSQAELLQSASPDRFNNGKIEQAFRRALTRYKILPYEGAVTVLRPRAVIHYWLSGGRRLQANRNIVLDDNGWSVHVKQLEVVEVPGDHDSMVLEPHVRVLAQHIRSTINAVAIRPPRTGGAQDPQQGSNERARCAVPA